MKKIFYIMMLGVAVLTSCKKDDEIPGTAMEEMAGEWFLRVSTDGGTTYSEDYYHFSTYNTAENTSTMMWLDDLESYWEFKGKVNVDLSSKTFSGADVANSYYDSEFSVAEGKILKGAAKASGSGAVTDSLYMVVKFSDSDNPETDTYIFSGYKKTGFLEDEH